MIPIKSGSQKGGVLSQHRDMEVGGGSHLLRTCPLSSCFFMMRKEPGGFFFLVVFCLLFLDF